MTALPHRLRPAGALAALLLALPLWGTAALAQDGEEAEAPKLTAIEEAWAKRPGAMSAEEIAAVDAEHKVRRSLQENRVRERIGRYLQAASKAIDEDGAEAAGELLDRLNVDRMNDHEKARVFIFRGFVAYQEGDTQKAIEFFRKALAQEILPVKDETRLRFNIAQLYAGEQDWEKTIAAIDAWMPWAQEPDPLAYYLKAIAYFQMDKFDEAIENAEAAVDLSEEPKEGWLQLLAALYIQKEDYQNAAPVLEELVLLYPKKVYWVQLSLIYGALDRYPRSLAVQQVAYAQGLLNEDKELRRLARSYLFANMPYQGAKVLEKGLADGVIEADAEAYEMLANSWIAAREYEKSLPPLERAAELSEDGNLYVRLGQVFLQAEDWESAIDALQKAVDKGSLRNPGTALLLLGISSYNIGEKGAARRYFVQARGHEKSKASAQGWLTYLDNEARSTADTSAAPQAPAHADGSNAT
jgi:tetratricopeptide (TPR) repeat protein